MNELQKQLVVQEYDRNPSHFTCHFCKNDLGIEDCVGCPLYSQGGFDPND